MRAEIIGFARAMCHLAEQEHHVQEPHDRVHPHEAEQREEDIPR